MAYALAYVNFFLYFCTLFWISMRSLLVVIGLVGAAVLLLSIGVILRKDHSFRSQHIHENERMRKDKIHCAVAEDKMARKRAVKPLKR